MAPRTHYPTDGLIAGIMSATRGPDMEEVDLEWVDKAKMLSTGVIRHWIDGWAFGTIAKLPFIVLDMGLLYHFRSHIVDAADFLGLPVILLPLEDRVRFWKAFHDVPYRERNAAWDGSFLASHLAHRVVHALRVIGEEEE